MKDGIDWDGPVPWEDVDNQASVAVPETVRPLTEERYEELTHLIDPLAESFNYGIDILLEVLEFLKGGTN